MIRARTSAVAAVAALAVAAVAPPGAAAAPLAFAPCAEADQRAWECATLTLPLDRSGAIPGTVALRVQRLAHDGPPRAKALVNIEGGPGASTTARSEQTRRLLGRVTASNGYDLVLLDVRATGASRPVEIEPGTSRFYSTADTVRDLDAVREALGIAKLAVMGTSYSTLFAAEYARTFPDRADKIVLDSTLPPGGPTAFDIDSVAAAQRTLRGLCARASCPGGKAAVVRDLAKAADRLRRKPRWVGSAGPWMFRGRWQSARGQRGFYNERRLASLVQSADESTALFALLPAGLRAAARGDFGGLAVSDSAGHATQSLPPINQDVNRITRCLDIRVPWSFEAPPAQRSALVKEAKTAIPDDRIAPFSRKLIDHGGLEGCVLFGPAGLPGAIRGGAMPAVPGVILQGGLDLRTPLANAEAMAAAWPSGTLVVAQASGHGVLRSSTACATQALDQLLGGRAVDGKACAQTTLAAEPLPVVHDPALVRPLPGAPRAVARTAGAIVASLRVMEVVGAAATPLGGEGAAGSSHGGMAIVRRTPPSTAMSADLRRYELFPGLALSGRLATTARGWTASLRVAGRRRGTVAVRGGRMKGRIDGVALDVRLPAALAKPAVTRYG